MPRQLVLPLATEPDHSRGAFIVGPSNRDALAVVEAWPDWPTSVVVLWGPAGTGKSHLTAIWRAASNALPIAFGSPAGSFAGSAWLLEDLEPEGIDETALFHAINAVDESGGTLLITARRPATEWPIALDDLRSRLRRALSVRLEEHDETFLSMLLVKLFADRQIEVDPGVAAYLAARMERSAAAARALVAAIDEAALARHGSVSKPLAREVLDRLAAASGEAAGPGTTSSRDEPEGDA